MMRTMGGLLIFIFTKVELHLKEITREEMDRLVKSGIVVHCNVGYVDKKGMPVSYMRTRHRQYIMDDYADMAREMMRGAGNGKEKVKN